MTRRRGWTTSRTLAVTLAPPVSAALDPPSLSLPNRNFIPFRALPDMLLPSLLSFALVAAGSVRAAKAPVGGYCECVLQPARPLLATPLRVLTPLPPFDQLRYAAVHLDVATYSLNSGCTPDAFCNQDNVCQPKGCRRDEVGPLFSPPRFSRASARARARLLVRRAGGCG